jgi:hypothetical protein
MIVIFEKDPLTSIKECPIDYNFPPSFGGKKNPQPANACVLVASQ